MSLPEFKDDASISGLRDQIKANAIVIFPNLVASHAASTDVVKATDTFEIVVSAVQEGCFQATVVYRGGTGLRRVAMSVERERVVEALRSLLLVTMQAVRTNLLAMSQAERGPLWEEKSKDGYIAADVVR
ncbi:hypothetical protein LTR10_007315 [Elasticomyces elasticus]|nr:hypothetical protein LTR10_007315 [Elasticomyces elasticus]KAK4979127.1 hypothetical protein LTR42_001629 [Elasticomyces elasticus]